MNITADEGAGEHDEIFYGSGFAQHPEAAAFVNPFRRRLILREGLESSVALMGQLLPFQDYSSGTSVSSWWHYGAALGLGSLMVVAGIHAPLRMTIAERPGLTVFLGYGGRQLVQQASRHWTCPPDGCLLLSGEAFSWESTLLSVVVFQLSAERLLHTATIMAGLSDPLTPWKLAMQHSHAWRLSGDAGDAPLQTLLRRELSKTDTLLEYSHSLVNGLQLDDQIYRLTAALLLPDLRLETPLERLIQMDQKGRDVFDELLDFIKLNLAQPLNLTMLERQSHYSRRTLQYAFRDRLGCTATQWIRNQRLDQARNHLMHPVQGDSVGSIATRCGYRSLSLFSIEFQQRFHVKPSQLLREARICQPPPAQH